MTVQEMEAFPLFVPWDSLFDFQGGTNVVVVKSSMNMIDCGLFEESLKVVSGAEREKKSVILKKGKAAHSIIIVCGNLNAKILSATTKTSLGFLFPLIDCWDYEARQS